ncbi:hypothetical protein WA026_011384 [Henosepilachna vigintioctopunctata]|uniref:acid phosphatase n=1 Tax=Henosepilachna vigintioctopunctata TaxID=420089 RepID=A0AAW1TTH7_9CUCU
MHFSQYCSTCCYIMRFVLFCVIFVAVNSVQTNDDSQLLSTIVLFRHGDRVPRKFAPLDPFGNSTFWPNKRGELTKLGVEQVRTLGRWLRNRYYDYLPKENSSRHIYIKSSSEMRCLTSAIALISGLFPTVVDPYRNETVSRHPFTLNTAPKNQDFIFEMAASCPKYVEAYDELLKTQDFRDIDASNSDFYEYLEEHLGVQIKSFTDVVEWYDTMREEDVKGFNLPDWTKRYYPTEMKKWYELCYKVPTYNRKLARFGTGALFEKISDLFDALINGSMNKSSSEMVLVLLSGHQTNIADVTNSLGMFRMAPYAGALIVELRKNKYSSKVFVNTFFKTDGSLEVLKIENCTVNCEIDNFFKIIKPFRISNAQIRGECGLPADWIFQPQKYQID